MRRLDRPTAPADIVKLIAARECEIDALERAVVMPDITWARRRQLTQNLRGTRANKISWEDWLKRCR